MPMFGVDEEEQRRLAGLYNGGSIGERPIHMAQGARQTLRNAPKMQQPEKEKGFWRGGKKFTGRDALAGALAAIGDGFGTWANGPSGGGATQMLLGGRFNALEEAKKAKAASDAAAAAERQRQRERGEGLQDYRTKKEIDRELSPTESNTFADKFGNRWQAGPDGGPVGDRPVFVETRPYVYIQGDRVVTIANPYATGGRQGGGQESSYKPGDIIDPADLGEMPANNPPNQMSGGAPRLQGQGTISKRDYDGILRDFGNDQRRVNEYMTRNNLIVVGN